jgi:myo-inositol-1(or 4)-monophosphatase
MNLIIQYLLKKVDFHPKLYKTFWVVDPLDGTANYARNIPICCVSIALISDLKPILGVIYDFINNDLYEGSILQKHF